MVMMFLISQSGPLQRSGFVTQMGRFDTHNDYREIVNQNFNAIDVGLKSFVTELKAQEVWDDVVVVAVSDFGRKLPPNGLGTDHAWGGMDALVYVIASESSPCLIAPSLH